MKLAPILVLSSTLLSVPTGTMLAAETKQPPGDSPRGQLHPAPKRATGVTAIGAKRMAPVRGIAATKTTVAKTPVLNPATLSHTPAMRSPAAHAGLPVAKARHIIRPSLVPRASTPGVIGGPATYDAKKGAMLQGSEVSRRR
ncbi:MAG: hypothetical protein ABSF94_00385 [Steroidobacteraceae bacterium]